MANFQELFLLWAGIHGPPGGIDLLDAMDDLLFLPPIGPPPPPTDLRTLWGVDRGERHPPVPPGGNTFIDKDNAAECPIQYHEINSGEYCLPNMSGNDSFYNPS